MTMFGKPSSPVRRLGLGMMVFLLVGLAAVPVQAAAEQASVRHDDVTVTATKTDVDRDSIPFDMYTVDRKDIDSQPDPYFSNVGELLRDIPGVSVGQVYPLGPPWIQLRGTGYFIGRTIYVVDGLPLLEPLVSTTINPNDISQVDVLLGPSSALYGPNASGGVVNMLTPGGTPGMGARASVSYGSFNTWRTYVSLGDRQDNLDYYFSYSRESSDGYQFIPVSVGKELYRLGKKQYLPASTNENAAYEKHYLTGKLGWHNSKGAGVTLAVNYMNGYMEGGQPNKIDDDHGDQLVSSLQAQLPISDIATLRFRGGYQYFHRPAQTTGGLSLDSEGNLVVDPTVTSTSDAGPRHYIPLEMQGDVYLGENNILTMGVFYAHTKDERSSSSAITGAQISNSNWEIDNWAFYAQDQQFFFNKRLSLVAGIRHDMWRYYNIYDMGSSDQNPPAVDKSHTTYRGGAKFKINDYVALRASAGTAFWPGAAIWFFQNVNTGRTQREANPDLNPEKTWMVDFGTDLSCPQTGTSASLTFYYGKITDMVSYRYDENPGYPGGYIIRTQNLGGAEIYGMEAMLSQKIVEHLFFRASLTLNHSRVEDTGVNDGHQLRNAPDYTGSVGLQYLNPELVNVDVRYRFSDSRYYDDENTDIPYFHMDAYQTLDAKVWRDWQLADRWTLTTTVSAINILDDEYEVELCYVAPGAYVEGIVSLRYAF